MFNNFQLIVQNLRFFIDAGFKIFWIYGLKLPYDVQIVLQVKGEAIATIFNQVDADR